MKEFDLLNDEIFDGVGLKISLNEMAISENKADKVNRFDNFDKKGSIYVLNFGEFFRITESELTRSKAFLRCGFSSISPHKVTSSIDLDKLRLVFQDMSLRWLQLLKPNSLM